MSAYQDWLDAKEVERDAVKRRRVLEDQMLRDFDISEQLEGVQNIDTDFYKIKVTGRMNRKVNGDLLQELALEHGLSDHLSTLFNWKPSINMKRWKETDVSITKPLMEAITTTAGRPSFSISIQEKS